MSDGDEMTWEQACQRGDLERVKQLLPRQSRGQLLSGLQWAAEHNHMCLIELFIDKGANDWNSALFGAAEGGHMHLVQLFIDKGANDWNFALAGAARGDHMHLVRFSIDKGADDWNYALAGAALGGHMHIVQFLIDKGADDWNSALYCAARDGHLHLVQFFIDKGAYDLNWALSGAVEGGHVHVIQHLLEQEGATRWPKECIDLLKQHPDVILWLFRRGKVPRERFAEHALEFEQQIEVFIEQVRQEISESCLLPRDLCTLVVPY